MVSQIPPKILTIAGSDSGGGAGIQADLKTIAAHGCYGLSVITALTAQNTKAVTAVHNAPVDFIAEQLDAVLEDIGCDAAKTGMLSTAEIIETVASGVLSHGVRNLVVDPVMVAKSGDRLLQESAIDALVQRLIPLARVITPNAEEAGVLLGRPVKTLDAAREAAREILTLGCRSVLVKGGHLDDTDEAVDVLYDGERECLFSDPRLDAKHTHGTGCTLSAAIASNLGKGLELEEAVKRAKEYLIGAMGAAYPVGGGIGPVNHLWRLPS